MTTSQDTPETADKFGRSWSQRCLRCRWKFRCPVEQLDREFCRACQSEIDAAEASLAR